jgi:hypothetical protein
MKVKTPYHKRTDKYGVELPNNMKGALDFDARNGNTLWGEAIAKEMRNVMLAFEFRDDDVVPKGYTLITCHMVFDLMQKARLVAWRALDGSS